MLDREIKILHLTLNKKWFYLIASEEKKFEYREGKPYWDKRLLDEEGFAIEFDEIHFRNGYRKDAPFMRVEWKNLAICPDGWIGEHGEVVGNGDFSIGLGGILEVRCGGLTRR